MTDKNSAGYEITLALIKEWQKRGDVKVILNLSELGLVEVPKEIGELKNLLCLHIVHNQLNNLPREVGKIKDLERLYADDNRISELPREINKLTNLRNLSLGKNQLTQLPEEIGNLKSLVTFNLKINQLSYLPKEIGELKNLTYLSLSNNQLSHLPKEIGELKNLRELSLSNNQLSHLPKEIGELKNLRELSLSNNQLSYLPEEIGELRNLNKLYLSNNRLSHLPKALSQLENLQILFLDYNPELNIPSEIITKHNAPQTILNYYFENLYKVKEEDLHPLKEVKVLLVGQGRVGKTSLVKYLVDDEKCNPEEPSTHGIIRSKWKVNVIEKKTNIEQNVQLNIWDFGGQDIQHQTHQFFLNQRSLYLLVLDAGRDETGNRLDYWLKKIELVGKDAPILIAINKSEPPNKLTLAEKELKNNFSNIRVFFNISCKTGQEIEELRATIKKEIGAIENVFEPIRKEWFAVKEYLEDLQEDYISRDKYREICRHKGVVESISQDTLLILLHELGVVLNFKEHETEVLNPEWVTRGVYQLVTSLDVQINKGILTPEILDSEMIKLKEQLIVEKKEYLRYPVGKYSFITNLMEKFELAYKIDDTENYFVPSLLPKDSPFVGEDWNEKECLGFRYNYESGLLHETIMSRFIVKMNRYILDKTQWLTGVLLKNEHGNKALVKADLSNGYLTILINGFKNTRREFLGIIRDKFRGIHKTNHPIEEVPLKDFPKAFVKYELLLGLEKEGVKNSHEIVDGEIVKYNVKDLLDSVLAPSTGRIEREFGTEETWKQKKSEDTKTYDVALSFSGEDRNYVKAVYEELQRENISVFYDSDEDTTIDLWGEDLIEILDDIYRKRSKVVVIFVSEHYAKKIWTTHERRSALANAISEQKVYVLPARFDNTEIPGLLPTVAFIELNNESPQSFAQKIIKKLEKLQSNILSQ